MRETKTPYALKEMLEKHSLEGRLTQTGKFAPVPVSVVLSRDLRQRADIIRRFEERSFSALVRVALTEYVEKAERKLVEEAQKKKV